MRYGTLFALASMLAGGDLGAVGYPEVEVTKADIEAMKKAKEKRKRKAEKGLLCKQLSPSIFPLPKITQLE